MLNWPALALCAQSTVIAPEGVGTWPSAHDRLPGCGTTCHVW